MLLKPLPVPDSDAIFVMGNQYPHAGTTQSSNSGVPDYYDRLTGVTAFEEQALFNLRHRRRRDAVALSPAAGSAPPRTDLHRGRG
ncbi:MAG: hypothetical protein DMF90_06330 [Acidobacteria bacterium]|nr:MAG: hypothetical protein DMF90_06330 [Acidobacteriota bacterium]